MFKDAKVGDRVWSYTDGEWGTIVPAKESNGYYFPDDYPIRVKIGDDIRVFTIDGKELVKDKNPTLFWDEVKFEIPKKPKEDTKVNNGKHKRMWQNNA